MRCRPELAPGRALCDAVSRLAHAAASRIAAGGLNGRSVAALARDLCVSERHLRRALERELGVSPLELAQTHRLLLAKRLLTDTELSVTRIAFASGFQSLRRFNSTFREQYRLSPTQLRASRRTPRKAMDFDCDLVPLTLAYRPPLDWQQLLACLRRDAIAGVEMFDGAAYGRTMSINGSSGVFFVEDLGARSKRDTAVAVRLSTSLVPALMPLLARLRQLLDLDAEPLVVDAHLRQGGLGELVRKHPGLRVPGAVDGFEMALRILAGDAIGSVVTALGDAIDTDFPALHRLMPTAARIADADVDELIGSGLTADRAQVVANVARAVQLGELTLEPGASVEATVQLLATLGVSERAAATIVMRALHWPDAFPGSPEQQERAAVWRPWRAYAALHLDLQTSRLIPRVASWRTSLERRVDLLP